MDAHERRRRRCGKRSPFRDGLAFRRRLRLLALLFVGMPLWSWSASARATDDEPIKSLPGLNDIKAACAKLELEGDKVPGATRDALLEEGKALLYLNAKYREGNLPLQAEAEAARRNARRLEAAARRIRDRLRESLSADDTERIQREAESLSVENRGFKEYVDRDLNPRIREHNSDLAERFATFSRIVDAAFSPDKRELDRQKEASLAKLDKRIEELVRLKERESTALRETINRVPQCNKALEDWCDLAADARRDARKKAFDTGLSLILIDQRIKLREGAEMTQEQLETLQTKLLEPDAKPDVQVLYSTMLADLRKVRSKEELVRFVERSQSFVSFVGALEKGKIAEATVEVAKLFLRDPKAQLLVGDVELVAAVGYASATGFVARREIETITEWSETELRMVNKYSRMLIRHTDQLKELRAQRRSLERMR